MSNKKTQEKEELMRTVLSHDRSLNSDELQTLKTSGFAEELNALKENSETIQKQTQTILDSFNLDALATSLKKDFGADFKIEEQESFTIVNNQEELSNKFAEIEEELNKKILKQSDYISNLIRSFRRPLVMGQQNSGIKNSILIWGEKATGRHSSLKELVRLLKEKEVFTSDSISTINIGNYQSKDDENNFVMDIYSAVSNSQIIVFDNIENTASYYLNNMTEILCDGQLSLSKRYVVSNNNALVDAGSSLNKNTISSISFKGKYLIFTSCLKPSKLLEKVGSRFVNNISDTISTAKIAKDDIDEIAENKFIDFKNRCLDKMNISVSINDAVYAHIEANYDGSNVAYVNEFFDQVYGILAEIKLKKPTNDVMVCALNVKDGELFVNEEQFSNYISNDVDQAVEEVKAEINQLVGLTEVKDYIFNLQDFYKANELKKKAGMKVNEISKHMIFTGNPGTGKTTIARLLAKYLKAIGVLSNGQLIEVSRNDLVGKYAGHTAPLTMQVIKSALGGILFIDEAYSLYRAENDSFGLEAIDTLVKAMEDHREDLIVILAGYTLEMNQFLKSNSGLQSRFPNQIEFPDYTGEELYQIAVINAKSTGLKIDEKAKQPLIDYFTKVQENDSVRSGNGRLSRNVVEEATINQSKRILKDSQNLDTLLLEDFDLENKK